MAFVIYMALSTSSIGTYTNVQERRQSSPTPSGSLPLVDAGGGFVDCPAVCVPFILEYEYTVLSVGLETVGSSGRVDGSSNEVVGAEGDRTDPHGLSSITERVDLSVVAHGLLDVSDRESSPLRTGGDVDVDSSPQALSVSLPRNSAVLPDGSLSPLPAFLKSFATPTYASCTTENAAEAFEESFPQTDFTPLPDKNSGGFMRTRLGELKGFGEGVRGRIKRGDEELERGPA